MRTQSLFLSFRRKNCPFVATIALSSQQLPPHRADCPVSSRRLPLNSRLWARKRRISFLRTDGGGCDGNCDHIDATVIATTSERMIWAGRLPAARSAKKPLRPYNTHNTYNTYTSIYIKKPPMAHILRPLHVTFVTQTSHKHTSAPFHSLPGPPCLALPGPSRPSLSNHSTSRLL